MGRNWWRKQGLDLWSIPHFLFGALMGMLPSLVGVSFLIALTLTVALATLWEMGEKLIGIRENFPNILFDIVLSVAACVLTSLLLLSYPLHRHDLWVIAAATFALYAFTNISGWLAFRRRNHDFLY